MNVFFTGLPRCGKSVLAEKFVARLSRPVLYVATLPRNAYYQATIEEHIARRPPDWQVLELVHDPIDDIPEMLNAFRRFKTIFIDGFSCYAFRCQTEFGIVLEKSMLSEISKRARQGALQMVLVDPPVSATLPLAVRTNLLLAHAQFFRYCDLILRVERGVATRMSAREAFSYDRANASRRISW